LKNALKGVDRRKNKRGLAETTPPGQNQRSVIRLKKEYEQHGACTVGQNEDRGVLIGTHEVGLPRRAREKKVTKN